MKIKNQFLVSITAFVIITAVIAGSILVSQQQTAQLSNQQELARSAQTHASNLAYLSSDYFLYQDNSSIAQWQAEFSSLSSDVSKISTSNPEQQALLRNVGGDAQQLNTSWNIVVSYLAIASRNVSIRVLPEFQADWSVMSAQNQALVFDAQQLSQSFRDQTDQLTLTSAILILVLLGLFGAYFIINYLITYRNTLKSISELQKGIEVIGSGNLDQRLKADKKDEIGEISRSFNKMVANLKTVTASKTDLERAQAALRESEQRWATTLSSIGDAVIATDTLSNITFMNAEAENLTGWTLREVSQEPVKTAFNIINEQTRHEVESPIDRVLKEGMIVGLANHTVLVRKDGTELPIDDSGAPIRDREGKTTGVVLIFRDITERK
ncbi:MAG TPA: PAS domain S-box protein, partial [Candidatus Nanoarchaeia archaeon]|nr:PAS domain S-box protein [Candidatus Nanoarchaeia archaeon]